MTATDGRVERGNATRRLVLGRTMAIASEEGLEALSLGRLATELSLSKSGVFALFGSKEGLQLATIRAASRVFYDTVVEPALGHPVGTERVLTLCEGWAAYSRERVFPGGCFFQRVSIEHAGRPGPVRDAIREAQARWDDFVRDTVAQAQAAGEIRPDEDVAELAFELRAALAAANAESVLHGSDEVYGRALAVVRRRLRSAAPN